MDLSHTQKPHVVCVPFPAQGHVNPFMQLAKLLLCTGFHITFVNTEFNHRRLVKSLGSDFVKGQPHFRFETIPDGLPPSDKEATQDIASLCDATRKHCYAPLKELIRKLNTSPEVPLVSSIIYDGLMGFAGRVARDSGISEQQFWTASACGLVGYLQFDELVRRGILPFEDKNFAADGSLDTTLDWISGMKNIRIRDLPSFVRTTTLDDINFSCFGFEAKNCLRSSSIIINTVQELESEVLDTLMATNPSIYNIGPLQLLGRHFPQRDKGFESSGSNLWKNDSTCIQWLDRWEPSSVIYVNYGSITVMSEHHLKEFAWGLANSNLPFLWIIRPDLVMGECIQLPQEFLDEVKDRGYITSWCPQDQVLAHPSVGIFITHCGWNSTLEGICGGVPMIGWPFFAEQQTNCRYISTNWGIGMAVNDDVKRDEVTTLVKEMITGEKGKEMRQKCLEWKKKLIEATDVGGSSYSDFYRLIKEALRKQKMDSLHSVKLHAVCVPFPAQGHVNPFMQFAKLLRCIGFHITFVNTEFNHNRLVKSLGPDFVKGLPDFRFETIPDGLPPSEKNATQDVPLLCDSTRKNCYEPLKELVRKLNCSPDVPSVSCIIADGTMGFAGKVAKDLGIRELQFWTASGCGFVGYLQYDELVRRGILPFKDENFVSDGTLDTSLDWISGMKNIRLQDLPSFIRTTTLDDIMFDFLGSEARNCLRSSSIIINTFQELEGEALDALKAKNPDIYSVGPLHLLGRHFSEKENGFMSSGSSFWKNDPECIEWLDKWEPCSVIYVNYGSITVMTEHHLKEFAWGLANSKVPFLWIMRPDVVMGESVTLPQEFLDEIKDRGYITSWCSQDQVLAHPSVGIFLTHCGWNSTIEGISAGVPMICWPFFAEQQTNCRYACTTWGIGMDINHDVKREEITKILKDMTMGEKGKEMRQKSLEWKKKAIKATDLSGSSYNDFFRLIKDALHHNAV
ncbi:uncharacterized protein LOC133301349 [Gastrolobium bilobum]|uniref:uncharacterized protein LOC133301349 n=1 Tax=Gastrolobium bilobum TaxID=150636 RepID=UPI002AB13FE9|nr:uncharacterized protein LOC133301349 [Gastrolobium bilobum]